MGKLTSEVFNPSCCDGEASGDSRDLAEKHYREHLESHNVPAQKMGLNHFTIKDSGERKTFAGGMVRDTAEGKTNYLLVRDGPMFERWAEHLRKGALKYNARNWMLAKGSEELNRARESAARHFEQWLRGDKDEDHAAAVLFNINQVEYINGL